MSFDSLKKETKIEVITNTKAALVKGFDSPQVKECCIRNGCDPNKKVCDCKGKSDSKESQITEALIELRDAEAAYKKADQDLNKLKSLPFGDERTDKETLIFGNLAQAEDRRLKAATKLVELGATSKILVKSNIK